MSEVFAQKEKVSAGAKVCVDKLTEACDESVVSCKRVVAEQNEIAGQYHHVHSSVQHLVKAWKDG